MLELSLDELKNTATNYEKLMVPALFVSWAERVLDEAGVEPGDRILDVACGTGIVARIAIKRTGSNGTSVTGLDPNPGMLAVAESKMSTTEWKEGVAEEIPFEDESFDVVVSQFGLMFFQDKSEALREMVRVLAPGGRLVVAVFDSLDNNPGYRAMTEIFAQVAGEEVADALRGPFSLGDTEKLKELCSKSGLSSAKVTTHSGKASFPDVLTMVLADVKGWFPLAGIHLTDEQIEEIVQQLESDLQEYISSDERLEFPMPAHFIKASK
ncbi:MAG: methyltransferase domain-containing protein [Balneolaceae bacterium]|nr:methyltransferase domain-containing protein [Balneolaceae bacterium]